ncbi:MAG TPA: cyclic nucleotide-binding domain-containing protein [Stellaceae bacterium]|nr:cyclic nucleotide-binding domain-containing protein [Stellaceae bacterium]
MAVDVAIAIVGSGPAGLSAAARAAKDGKTHVLLERTAHVNDTIFKYQKRKHVMATPEFLPLRSDLGFKESSREEVIEGWVSGVEGAKANIRLNTEVTSIKGQRGNFQLGLANGETITAEHVVLSIGVQGNLRKLAIPGAERADHPFVQYQLDDPDEYHGEEIIVIGTGDAGIENALALSANNNVTIINRVADYPYAKPANAALIQGQINKGGITAFVNSEPKAVEDGCLVLDTADGEARVKCDRIIARIGALPPRKFVESCGIKFPSDSPTAYPVVSETYESEVPGLYIVGALAGYPLIKHCLNQGYEVVEYILGNNIPPADEPLIQDKLDKAGVKSTVTELVTAIRERLPLYKPLTPLQIREFLLHSELHQPRANEIIFKRNDYTNSLYSILDGEVGIQIDPADPTNMVKLGPGKFFGEMGLISGRRRTATVIATKPSILLEVDRNTMVKLRRSVPDIAKVLDRDAVVRQIETYLAPGIEEALLHDVLDSAKVLTFKPNDPLIKEGADVGPVYLIRKGSVTISRSIGGKDIVFAYLPAGNYVGEMAMLTNAKRNATVKASVLTEAIEIDSAAFRSLLERAPHLRHEVEKRLEDRLSEQKRMETGGKHAGLIEFLVRNGLGEATDVLLIDETLCVRCDNCEKACAETHHGVSRLNREAGPTFATIHVPTSCRHCEDPSCMKDCPADAIHRAPNGEVFIDDKCIGCGNCERNCPYGVIQMAAVPAEKPSLLSWLFFGRGNGPGEDKSPQGLAKRTGSKHAVKCDMCKGIEGGPACVRACPTGAAIRVNPEQFISVIRGEV